MTSGAWRLLGNDWVMDALSRLRHSEGADAHRQRDYIGWCGAEPKWLCYHVPGCVTRGMGGSQVVVLPRPWLCYQGKGALLLFIAIYLFDVFSCDVR